MTRGNDVRSVVVGLSLLLFSGCIHIHRKAPIAAPEVAERIQFPQWGKSATAVTGSQLKALQIAMDDFRPPGSGSSTHEDALVRCLQKIENYDAWVVRGEGLTFIHFTPEEGERCGLDSNAVDLGVSYAVSDDGIILKRE